jgi:hypothetical protein
MTSYTQKRENKRLNTLRQERNIHVIVVNGYGRMTQFSFRTVVCIFIIAGHQVYVRSNTHNDLSPTDYPGHFLWG